MAHFQGKDYPLSAGESWDGHAFCLDDYWFDFIFAGAYRWLANISASRAFELRCFLAVFVHIQCCKNLFLHLKMNGGHPNMLQNLNLLALLFFWEYIRKCSNICGSLCANLKGSEILVQSCLVVRLIYAELHPFATNLYITRSRGLYYGFFLCLRSMSQF